MNARDELLAAIDEGDHMAVRRRDWGAVWESLATSNAPRQGCTLNELRPYVKMLGNEPVEDILEALEACAGEWRPSPGQLKGWLNAKRGDAATVDVGRGRDRSSSPEALRAVADAIHAGEQPCTCGRPVTHDANGRPRRPRWLRAPDWVLRCSACDGIEQGQVYSAEDAGLLEVAA